MIHPLDGTQERELLRMLWERLEAGTALLYADLIEAKSEDGRRHMARAWGDEVQRSRSGSPETSVPTTFSWTNGGTGTSTRTRRTSLRAPPGKCGSWRKGMQGRGRASGAGRPRRLLCVQAGMDRRDGPGEEDAPEDGAVSCPV